MKKLALNFETLRSLNETDTNQVAGGKLPSRMDVCLTDYCETKRLYTACR